MQQIKIQQIYEQNISTDGGVFSTISKCNNDTQVQFIVHTYLLKWMFHITLT